MVIKTIFMTIQCATKFVIFKMYIYLWGPEI